MTAGERNQSPYDPACINYYILQHSFGWFVFTPKKYCIRCIYLEPIGGAGEFYLNSFPGQICEQDVCMRGNIDNGLTQLDLRKLVNM